METILADLKLADSFFGLETGIEPQVLSDDNAGRSYLKGAFLAAGSIRDPESGKYQLEIYSVYLDHAQDLAQLMQKFMLDAKTIEHKKRCSYLCAKGRRYHGLFNYNWCHVLQRRL